jgi:hypothetical protein
MSLRRAIELNYKSRLENSFVGSAYKVVEGVSKEERPSPVIIVLAGEGQSALPEMSDDLGNFICDVSIIIMSSIDVDGVDQHNDAVWRVSSCLATREAKRISVVEGLYIYDFVRTSQGESNDETQRKIGSVFNYRATVNYNPKPFF